MMLTNISKDRKICSETESGKSVLFKFRGLMFTKKIEDFALVFGFNPPRRIDLHMLFVFYPIDVALLDKDKEVLELKEHFMPFTFYYSKKAASFVAEMPDGSIRKGEIEIGDTLEF
jgi:uncharacterized protein